MSSSADLTAEKRVLKKLPKLKENKIVTTTIIIVKEQST